MAVYIHDTHIISPLGFGTQANFQALINGQSGVAPVFINDQIGSVYAATIDRNAFQSRIASFAINFDGSYVEQLLVAALHPIITKNKIKSDSVLILSTTKGNIAALGNQQLDKTFITNSIQKVNSYFGFKTQPIVISNACVSGVLALSVAKRLIETNMFSNAYVIAVDEVTPFVLSGFQSFQAMSQEQCKPYDADRAGVNLGEASVAVYVSNEHRAKAVQIAGDANINDANHISGPSRTGEGLVLSIEKALQEANVTADQIDYISAHGTATLYNDEMEAIAFNRTQLQHVPLNSFKAYYGHTLGASGLLESVLTVASLQNNTLITSLGYKNQGTTKKLNIITQTTEKMLKTALKTASGFGGSNSAMVFIKKE